MQKPSPPMTMPISHFFVSQSICREQVEILVDDGTDVEAGTLGTVIAAGGGCDPPGCIATLTRVGSATRKVFAGVFVGSCALDMSDGLILNTSCSKNKKHLACVAEILQDGNLSDGSRWYCSPSLGGDYTISYDLGAVRDLTKLRLGRCR